MIPRNPLNDSDVDGNTMAWMADKDRESCGCGGCGCEDEKSEQEELEDKFDQAENACDDR
jgi:hypothetical protein